MLAERPIASVSRPKEMTGGTEALTVTGVGADVITPLVAVTVVAPRATPVTTPDAEMVAVAAPCVAKVNVPPGMKKLFASRRRGVTTAEPFTATTTDVGVISIEVITCATVSAAVPVTPWAMARTAVKPFAAATARAVAVPIESSVATDGLDDVQVNGIPVITTSSVSYATAR